MSIWIFKNCIAAGLASFLLLSGCDFSELGQTAPMARAQKDSVAANKAVIAGGRIVVRSPAGYCVDRETLDETGRNGFVMLARCDLLRAQSEVGLSTFRAPALIFVTTRPWTGPAAEIDLEDLAAAYPSETVLEARKGPPLALIRASGGAPELDGVDEIHWRGAFVLNEQLVTLSLFAPPKHAMLGDGGGQILTQLARRIARESAQFTNTQ